MRVLFFAHNGQPYGANKSLLSLLRSFGGSHDVLAFFPIKNSLGELFKKEGIPFCVLPYFATVFFFRKKLKYFIFPFLQFLNLFVFPFVLIKAIWFKPDLIYSNSSMENIGWLIAKLLNVRHISHVREFGDKDYSFYPIFGEKFKTWYLNSSDGVVFNSNIVKEHVLPLIFQETKTRVVYNGIKLNDELTFSRCPDFTQLNFGIVGYIHPLKGQLESASFLVPFLKSNKGWKLHLFGDGEGPYLKNIQDYAINKGVDGQLIFHGFIKDVTMIYSQIDLLLMFSKFEAFGRVTIEAMANGIPVIGLARGGTKELINDGSDGFLFNDEKEFQMIIQAVIGDPKLYENLSGNAAKRARIDFSEQVYCDRIEEFIKELN
jgi:L-malate glycosyltransferase